MQDLPVFSYKSIDIRLQLWKKVRVYLNELILLLRLNHSVLMWNNCCIYFFFKAGNLCFFGECDYYCDSAHAFCGHPDMIEASVQSYLPSRNIAKRKSWYQPWRRSYRFCIMSSLHVLEIEDIWACICKIIFYFTSEHWQLFSRVATFTSKNITFSMTKSEINNINNISHWLGQIALVSFILILYENI